MIGNAKLFIDVTPLVRKEICTHGDLLLDLAKNYADAFYLSDSIKDSTELEELSTLLESTQGESKNPTFLGLEDLRKIAPDEIFLSFSNNALLDENFLKLACRKSFLLSISDDRTTLEQKIKACHQNEIELIMADFLPDEISWESFVKSPSFGYFLDKFIFLGPAFAASSLESNIGKASDSAKILLIIDSKSCSGQEHKSISPTLLSALRKSNHFEALDISDSHGELLAEIKSKIIARAAVVSSHENLSILHHVHLICGFIGKPHFIWAEGSFSPIRFLFAGQSNPLFDKGFNAMKGISLRQQITLVLKAVDDPNAEQTASPKDKSERFSSHIYAEKISRWLSSGVFEGLEECYRDSALDSGSPHPSLVDGTWPTSVFSKWAQGPFAPKVSDLILKRHLHPELKQDEELLESTRIALIESVFCYSPHLNNGAGWPHAFLSKATCVDEVQERLESLLTFMLNKPDFQNAYHLNTLRAAIWPYRFFASLLNPEQLKESQSYLHLGERFLRMEISAKGLSESPFSWLLLFLLYQEKSKEALALLDEHSSKLNDSFVQGQVLTSIQVLWLIGDEDLASATMESHNFSYKFFSDRDLLLCSILSALTGCWEKAEESYRLISEKNPDIFLRENLLKPRNFWLLQSLVYKKVGNSDLAQSFLSKAKEIDPYWGLHMSLLDRDVSSDDANRDCVPQFNL